MRERRLGLIGGLVWALSAMSVGCDGGTSATDGGTDGGMCQGRALCAAEGTRCDGDSLVACEVDADGCIVETMRTTCESGCLTAGGVARCVDASCEGVSPADRCDTAGRSCDGTSLEVCAPNANGCLVRTTTPCDAERGCGDVDGVAACLGGPCVGDESCDTEERRCDGDALRVCERDAAGCLQRADVDCAASGELCGERDGMAVCGSTCAFRPPCVPRCDGRMATTCVPDAEGCLVEGPATDCGTAVCAEGVGCAGNCATAQPQALACNTTVMGNNAGGGNTFNQFSCVTAMYGGPEVIHMISVPEDRWVAIDLSWAAGASEDYDLFVVDGGTMDAACGPAMPCVSTSALNDSDRESVSFRARAGRVYYVVFNRSGTEPGTPTDYTLQTECMPIPAECDFVGLVPPVNEMSFNGPGELVYSALDRNLSELVLELFSSAGAPSEPGSTVEFTGENYRTCATCLRVRYLCETTGPCTTFLAQSGSVTFTELDQPSRTIRGQFRDVRLAEVTVSPTFDTTLVPGGRTWCLPLVRFRSP